MAFSKEQYILGWHLVDADSNFNKDITLKKSKIAIALTLAYSLSACGGGGSDSSAPTPEVDPLAEAKNYPVTAIDGYLKGALVCLDTNDNGQCDTGEPSDNAGNEKGEYSLEIPGGITFSDHKVIVEVTAETIDMDEPDQTVGKAYRMTAPAGKSIITPMTTIVNNMMIQDDTLTPETAADKVVEDFGLPADTDIDVLLGDYIKKVDETVDEDSASIETDILIRHLATKLVDQGAMPTEAIITVKSDVAADAQLDAITDAVKDLQAVLEQIKREAIALDELRRKEAVEATLKAEATAALQAEADAKVAADAAADLQAEADAKAAADDATEADRLAAVAAKAEADKLAAELAKVEAEKILADKNLEDATKAKVDAEAEKVNAENDAATQLLRETELRVAKEAEDKAIADAQAAVDAVSAANEAIFAAIASADAEAQKAAELVKVIEEEKLATANAEIAAALSDKVAAEAKAAAAELLENERLAAEAERLAAVAAAEKAAQDLLDATTAEEIQAAKDAAAKAEAERLAAIKAAEDAAQVEAQAKLDAEAEAARLAAIKAEEDRLAAIKAEEERLASEAAKAVIEAGVVTAGQDITITLPEDSQTLILESDLIVEGKLTIK